MYTEDNLLPLSATSQYAYCPRRFALVHIEQLWSDNIHTAVGNVLHKKVHSGVRESRGDTLILRSLRLRSLRLGISGITDVVEMIRTPLSQGGIQIPGIKGTWLPLPVEYKKGTAKNNHPYEVQLCAQAICLEEMLGCHINVGALFYGETRRRCEVVFDEVLRQQTETVCARLHELVQKGITPSAVYEKKKCDCCSLLEICLPRSMGKERSAQKWLTRQIDELSGNEIKKPPEDMVGNP
ncbi:MAG: CRISPR-associated protein Cas4 [Kiritimatiellae bacterium]|nr:CRISPR-associated protein Cas4 [Kiritimatiellia bacterium]